MASDGPEAWTVKQPERSFVLARMVRAINRWNLKSRRNINYGSFAPIIRLLGSSHTPECQLWAVWALANLSTVSPDKYCQLVEEEGGLGLVEEMLNNNSGEEDAAQPSVTQVKDLARTVRTNVLLWKEQGGVRLEFDG